MANKIGFIGLGEMGKGMAKNLVKKGFDLNVFDVREEPVAELVQLGAKKANSLKEMAIVCDVVFTMVRDDAQTLDVIQSKEGVLPNIKSGSTIVISSTVSPSLCQRLAREAAKKGVGVIDAPVSGAKAGADAGTLTLMIGGDEASVKKMEPIFQAVSANRFHLGGSGMGETGKLANNMILFSSMASTTEGITFATKSGIPLKTFLAFLNVSTGSTWVSQRWDYLATLKKDHSPTATLKLMYKDLNMGLSAAKEIGVDLSMMSKFNDIDLWREVG